MFHFPPHFRYFSVKFPPFRNFFLFADAASPVDHPAQLHRQFRRTLRTFRRIFAHHTHNQRADFRRNLRIDRPGIRRPRLQHLPDHIQRTLSFKRKFAGKNFIQSRAEAVDIASGVYAAGIGTLLRRSIGGSADHPMSSSLLDGISAFGNAEISQLDVAGGSHHDIFRFDVPMDDAESCRRLQCLRHPQRNHQRPFPVDHIAAVDHLLNRPTVDVFHHQHAHARRLVDSGIDHRDDSRMTDPAGNSAFPKKFLHKVRSLLHDRRQQHLDRHLAARNFGNGKINLPHAAAAEKSFNPVLSETVSCLKHRIRRKIHLISPSTRFLRQAFRRLVRRSSSCASFSCSIFRR